MTDEEIEITREITEWIRENDCRSISICYEYARESNSDWKNILKKRKAYSFLKTYILSRNEKQRSMKIKAPKGMTLFE